MKNLQLLPEFHKSYLQWFVLLTAIFLPFVIIRSYPEFFHSSDVDDFFRWSQAWKMGWQDIYINCDRCNYPLLGTFLSGGVMSLIPIENFIHLAARFRYYLAAIDACNVIIIYLVLMKLKIKNAPLWAGVIGLLPSSWLGSSVWGQIDGLGQFFILMFFLLIIWFNSSERPPSEIILFSFLAGMLLLSMLLTKQLIYFSMFALGVILLINLIFISRNLKIFIYAFLTVGLSILIPILLIDINLNLSDPYFSHLQYILATGSQHGDKISYVGMNIWTFFAEDLLSSSYAAIPIRIGSMPLFSIVPYYAGIVLFLLINGVLIIAFWKYIWKARALHTKHFDKHAILFSLIYLALVNLSFNLTLTGVHERYLYHFYPFIVIACLGWLGYSQHFNRITLLALLMGAMIYGLFLYGYLTSFVKPTSLLILQGITALHLILLFYLAYSFVKMLNNQTLNEI